MLKILDCMANSSVPYPFFSRRPATTIMQIPIHPKRFGRGSPSITPNPMAKGTFV